MNNPPVYKTPIIDSVFHPTDFSEGSLTAFNHALKIALISRSQLTLLHIDAKHEANWTDFPSVRDTLERWGIIPMGSPKSAVPQLGIDVRKAITQHSNPVKAVLHYLDEHMTDLIVIATHQHEGRAHWLKHAVAEPVARQAMQMTLFLPNGCRGFVSPEDGTAHIKNIIIPIASTPKAQPALHAAVKFAAGLNATEGTFTIVYVGEADEMPAVHCPELDGWTWKKIAEKGDVVESILKVATHAHADLMIMATDGRNGFLDAIRGSHSERLLHHAHIPILTIPVGSLAGNYFS